MGATNYPNGVSVSDVDFSIGQKDIIDKVKVIRIKASDTDGSAEVNTGWKLPPLAIIENVLVNVITPESSGTIKKIYVGTLSTETGGSSNGYLTNLAIGSAGIKSGEFAVTETTGANEKYISAITTSYGILLAQLDSELGTDLAGNTGYVNLLPLKHLNSNGNTISWKPASTGFAELVADIIIFYKELV